jgi:hypothetical protein
MHVRAVDELARDPGLKLVMVVTAVAKNANVGKESFAFERGAVWRGIVEKFGSW